MTSVLHLDPGTARRVADLDPALGLLPAAVPLPARGRLLELHDVRWIPGQDCALVYRVGLPGGPSTFESVSVGGDGWVRRDFREDPGIPGVSIAADPVAVRGLLVTAVGRPVQSCRVEPVRYRPGSRCVLRYDAVTRSGPIACYAKVFTPGDFPGIAARAQRLTSSPDGAALTASLVATWPQHQVLVWAGLPGRSVAALLEDRTVSSVQRAGLAHRVGELLGALHQVEAVDAPERTASDVLRDLRDSLTAVMLVDGHLGERLVALHDRLDAQLPQGDPGGEPVLAHGSFRAGQAVAAPDGRVRLLDLDTLCRAARGRDLGTLLAHLLWQRLRHPAERVPLSAAEAAALTGYLRRTRAEEVEGLTWWRAVGLLQVAARRYSRLESEDWHRVPDLVDAAASLVGDKRLAAGSPGDGSDLLDLGRMTTLLRGALSSRAPDPRAMRVESARMLATAPDRRHVVRYTVSGLDDRGAVRVVGKAFSEARRARLLHDHLTLLHDGPFGRGPFRVPEPLGLLAEHRLVLYRHCTGVPLLSTVARPRGDDGVRRAARWLATLHGSGLVMPRTFSLERERDNTRDWAAAIARAHPRLADRSRALAEGWCRDLRSAAVVAVPIHKDLHPGHVLLGEQVWVVDLDEARQGDPTFDVAHFCTYLDATARGGAARALTATFLEEYAAAAGSQGSGSWRQYRAYAWLKIAKQRSVGSGPFPPVAGHERSVLVEHAVREAERCLNG